MLPRRRNNTQESGIIKEGRRRGGALRVLTRVRSKKRNEGGTDILRKKKKTLSVRFFISGQIPRPHSDDRPEQFVHPSRPRPPVFRPSYSNSIDPIQHSTRPSSGRGRETDHAVGRPRPADPLVPRSVRPAVRRCQVINISNLARLHSFPLFT